MSQRMRITPRSLTNTRRCTTAVALLVIAVAGLFVSATPSRGNAQTQSVQNDAEPRVAAVPEEVIQRFNLDSTFYKKHLDYEGFPILSSDSVSDAALLEARYLIDQLLGEREDILDAMIKAGCRFMVMAPTEMTTDVPEQRNWNKEYWDRRARGMGGRLSSCGEENLLNLKGDRYNRENILIHEFNHAIHQHGLRAVDPAFDGRLKETYKSAMAKDLWKGMYSATSAGEYWSEGVQAYFDCMRPQYGANTREKLRDYDPDLFALVDEVYRQSKFRYVRYDKRHAPAAKRDPSALDPIVYTIKTPAPDTHFAEVEMTVPTGRRESIELMMTLWTPGFYRVENYAGRIEELSACIPDGTVLEVEQPQKNRWRVRTSGAVSVIVKYRLRCDGRSVTTNWVGGDFGVFNGAATFLTLVEKPGRPHEVRLELPPTWKQAITALDPALDGIANHFRAPDFDTLVDSPIVAGDLIVNEFEVAGSKHIVADVGEVGQWDSRHAAADLEKLVRETHRFWGFLPFERYVFLNVFRRGGGGLEHKNSCLLTSSSARSASPSLSWLSFVSHEYFHAFNVKRLRPIELEPFDYENPPRTPSLWISEGLTTYFGDLIVARAGLAKPEDFLSQLSSHIRQLQSSPGRLVQTLEQSSLDVWSSGTSGVGRDNAKTVSYYVKGPVVGFLLDARIRRTTGGTKSLDDVMRLAYQRFSGERGFTPDDFRKAAEEVVGVDLAEWFHKSLASTEELDYAEALDWFGLRFAAPADPQAAKTWKLEIREDTDEIQKSRLRDWLRQSTGKPYGDSGTGQLQPLVRPATKARKPSDSRRITFPRGAS